MQKVLTYITALVFFSVMSAACKKSLLRSSETGTAPVPEVTETGPALLTPVPGRISANIFGYYEALPAHYQQTNQKYPVIFFFQGGGQYGDGHTHLDTVLADGIGKLLRDKIFPPSFTVASGTFSFIVIIPQLVKKINDNSELDSLINYAKAKYRIDSSRVYLSGFSMGGKQVCDYAAYKPLEIAAVTSMSGMPGMTASLDGKCKAIADARLPLWQFHAKNDSAWKYTESVKFISTINNFNPAVPPKFTLFEKGERRLNHDSWTKASDPAYKEDGKNIYEWMLGYTR
jgi:predicted peptidase